MKSTVAWIAISAGGILWVPAVASALFDEPQVISASGGPTMVVGGDLDNDGTIDLAVTAPALGRIFVHSGRGDGSFRFPRGLDVDGEATVLATGDIDRDGRLDLIWAEELSGDVGVAYQLATNPVTYRIEVRRGADEPRDVLVADVDGDLWPDVITANHGADLVSVYPNLDGALGLPYLYDVGDGPEVVIDLSVAPLRRFAVVQTGALSTNVGLYDGAFEPVQLLNVAQPAGIDVVDWNGDAFPDVTITDRAGQGLVYSGGPAGQLTLETTWALAPSASTLRTMRTVGGEPGAVVLEQQRNRIVLSARTGPQQIESLGAYFVGQDAGRFLWMDLDGDAAEELVVPMPEEEILVLMRRQGDRLRGLPSVLSGRFPQQVEIVPAAGGRPPRAAVLCPTSHETWIYEIANGRLDVTDVLPAPPLARRIRWAMLDADELPDLVVLDSVDGFWVHRGEGAGFAPPRMVSVPGDFRDVAIVAWGGGTEKDILATDAELRGARVFRSDGAGGYTEAGFFTCQQVPVVAGVVDLDVDGYEDLVTLGNGNTVCLSYNGPDGLDQQTIFTLGDEPRGLAFGRFNADALPDIAIGNAGDETFTVLVSLLPRIFGLGAQNQVTPSGSQTAAVLDFNADGRDDLAFTSLASRSVSLHAGVGNGTFTVPTRVRCSSLPFDVEPFDVDGDQRLDLLVLDTLGDAVVSLLTGTPGDPIGDPSGVKGPDIASGLYLAPLYPNPSEGIVHVRLRVGGELAPSARVYDLRGRKVADLRVLPGPDGWFSARWDGRDDRGQSVARGRYLVELRAGGERAARAVMLH